MRASAVAVVLFALLVSGCGKKADPQAVPSVATSAGGSATPAATETATASPSKTPGGDTGPTYPGNAKDYTKALLQAWSAKNTSRINQLANQGAALQIGGMGTPNGEWNTYVSCNPDGSGYTKCIYRNVHGDEATIRLQNSQIGHPTAVTEALLDKTQYPNDAAGYAQAFWGAWSHGNTDRMRRLSNSGSVVSFFNGKEKPTGATAYPTDAGQYVNVRMEGLPAGAFTYTLKVQKSLLGKPSAIVGASN